MATSLETAEPVEVSAAEQSGPDWSLVPFQVGCARCGHDLRGLSEPKCPACGFEFDWAQAVPIEQLTCGKCGYHLYGLQETRCPECGEAFTWEQALDDYHRRCKPLFEYHWRTRPLRSFFGTWFRALRPGRFWRFVELHDPVRPGPILAMVAAFLAVFVVLPILSTGVEDWLRRWFWTTRFPQRAWMAPGLADLPWYVLGELRNPRAYYLLWSLALWSVCLLASLMIFRQSMRLCRVRSVHVLRVWALSVPLWVPVIAFAAATYFCTAPVRDAYIDERELVVGGALILLGIWAYTLCRAYRLYLHMPHSEAVVAAALLVAFLAFLFLELATVPNVRVSVSFAVLEWLRVL
jgi:ribosomal protein L37E